MQQQDLADYRLDFNGSIRVEARPERLTSEAGVLLERETLEKLGTVRWLTERLNDPRDPRLITHPLGELLTTALLLKAQGWRDGDDADTLRDDAALRLAVSQRRGVAPLKTGPRIVNGKWVRNRFEPDGLASQPTLSRLSRLLSTEPNRQTLRMGLLKMAARRIRATRRNHRLRYVTLDVDSLPIEVHGEQPGSKYNGHYHARIYHPLAAYVGETGDAVDLRLREGNAHTAEGDLEFILPLLDRVEAELCQVAAVRIDAGFPDEPLLSALERRGTPYVARVKNNAVLDAMARPYHTRPPGRPPAEPRTWLYEMSYQAKSWSKPRRVVLVVLERWGELLMHHFWLITNWSTEQVPGEELLERYRQRGTAEAHMGELMSVIDPALSSSPREKEHYRQQEPQRRYVSGDSFAINEVLLLLNGLAYNLLNVVRLLVEGATRQGWGLGRVRERVLRVAGRLIVHGRRITVVVAQGATALWRGVLAQLQRLRPAET